MFEKILEKIYSEKDLSTNVAIFVGALSSLGVYSYFDKDSFLGLVAFVSLFALTKIIAGILINKYTRTDLLAKKLYSQLETSVISAFVDKGTSFLVLSDLQKGKYGDVDSDGLDSLVARGVIEFIDNSWGEGPTGFQLREDVYRLFLN